MADDDYRPTEPVMVYEPHGQPAAEPPPVPTLPERTWKDNPLLWICVVVVVFMAVPFFAYRSTRVSAPAKPAVQASAPAAEAEQPVATETAPPSQQPEAPRTATPRSTPVPVRAAPDAGRQMVTKCVERGRVVYTQTGECAGSVSAVPIDTGKNVVGPGGEPQR
ncbi:MAG TPA: hypothetical protein VFU71_11105 [Burkholderiaceae bacterium]|nr:hypothetical protein [Burkholderiaceae bacterium]